MQVGGPSLLVAQHFEFFIQVRRSVTQRVVPVLRLVVYFRIDASCSVQLLLRGRLVLILAPAVVPRVRAPPTTRTHFDFWFVRHV